MPRLLLLLLLLGTTAYAEPKSEIGEINGAQFRIDVPDPWNGVLLMYCHGYSPVAGTFKPGPVPPAMKPILAQGYAVAQSGYAKGGWAIQEAVQDTEALRRYFLAKYGKPKETYVSGHSMGGFLTMALIEQSPTIYDGGLALCGPLAPAAWFMERRVFDMRVVFDYYFPGLLPPPDAVPADFALSPVLNAKVLKVLQAQPQKAEIMRSYSGIRTDKELASTIVFWTFILKDLQQRCGGNPFDNRNTIYDGTGDDDALNDHVARYTADPGAKEYLRVYYAATGHLSRPLLAIHTTYDPLVPPWVTNEYSTLTESTGSSDWFVQQYVKRPGHCAITPAEMLNGLQELRAWDEQGKKPAAGSAASE